MLLRSALVAALLAFGNAVYASDDPKVVEQHKTQQSNEKIVMSEISAWLGPVVRELSTSRDDVDRAYAYGLAKVDAMLQASLTGTAAPETAQSLLVFDDQAKQALLDSKTSPEAKLLYMLSVCSVIHNAECLKALELKTLDDEERNNAFWVLTRAGFQSHASNPAWQDSDSEEVEKKSPEERNKFFEQRTAERQKKANELTKELLRDLKVTTRFDDFGLTYKARLRKILKSRPIPETLLARMGPEQLMLVKFFPQEDLGAAIVGNALVGMAFANTRYGMTSDADEAMQAKLKAEMDRITNLAMANPKTSMITVMMLGDEMREHALIKKMDKYKNLERSKSFSASQLLTTNWIGLRPVLAKAVTQGDVAAVDDAIAWADAALAKIPDKTAVELAEEKRIQDEADAKWKERESRVETARAKLKAECEAEATAMNAEKKLSAEQIKTLQEKCVDEGMSEVYDTVYTDIDGAAEAASAVDAAAAASEAAAAVDAAEAAAVAPDAAAPASGDSAKAAGESDTCTNPDHTGKDE